MSRRDPTLAVVHGSANHLSSPIHNSRVGVVNASASSHQQTLRPQKLRSLLLAISEHVPPGISQRSSSPPTQLLLSRSRPQVLAGRGHTWRCPGPHPLRRVLLHSFGTGWTPWSRPWPVREGQRAQTRCPSGAQSTSTWAADPQISC